MSVPLSHVDDPMVINDRGHLLEAFAQRWAEQLQAEAWQAASDPLTYLQAATQGWVDNGLTLEEVVRVMERGAWLYGQGEPS